MTKRKETPKPKRKAVAKTKVKAKLKPARAQMAAIVIERITSGLSLRKATEGNQPISMGAFLGWVNEDPILAEQYARARDVRADIIFDEILEIADDSSNDTITTDEGYPMENREWVNRSKLRVDARRWALGKMSPKKFGDKVDVTSGDMPLKANIIYLGNGTPPTDETTS